MNLEGSGNCTLSAAWCCTQTPERWGGYAWKMKAAVPDFPKKSPLCRREGSGGKPRDLARPLKANVITQYVAHMGKHSEEPRHQGQGGTTG